MLEALNMGPVIDMKGMLQTYNISCDATGITWHHVVSIYVLASWHTALANLADVGRSGKIQKHKKKKTTYIYAA